MTNTATFGLAVTAAAGAALLAVVSNRVTERLRVPAPALFLVAAATAGALVPRLHAPPHRLVEQLVTLALVVILFDGGLHIGAKRFRAAARPIVLVGIPGTLATTAAAASLLHLAFGAPWYVAVLVGTAIAPTDPAVVFSVLGRREVVGNSGTVLEGESGANDPVGIALMGSLIAAGGLGPGAFAQVAGDFALQFAVGAVFGVLGARTLLVFMRRVPLPSEGLYPLRTLACVLLLFGITSVAHGSGLLAVFIAGIGIGDERAPYKNEVHRFHSALASLGEIVAFIVLGLTVDFNQVARSDVWVPGVVVGLTLALVIRPLFISPFLLRSGLARHERAFVLLAGLKGAVPILLGTLLLEADVADAKRYYSIIVVVVAVSVVFQAGAVPALARALRVPMRTVEPEPWALGVRLRDDPGGVHRVSVGRRSIADGNSLADLPLGDDVWVSFAVRQGVLLPIRGDTQLQAGDELLILADADLDTELRRVFDGSGLGPAAS
ncbi:MAG: cation:proton antiporter [Actinomycetota bacterium]|nr:cation:proton antiporter [Actinomycetota bacterium]